MKGIRKILIAVLAMGTAITAYAADTNVAGTWNLTTETQRGTRNASMVLTQSGENVTGTYKGQRGDLPISGTIKRVAYISGKFLNADLDKASEENERQHILVERGDGVRIGFTQIAGLVARRIVPFVKPGDIVAKGQRIGLIRFGSRVDVFLPAGTAPQVALGQRTIAGETILARIGEGQGVTGISQ